MKHDFTCEFVVRHGTCKESHCNVCDGGLAVCIRCGLVEGSLTTDCPGEPSYVDHSDEVYAGKKDFIEGKGWVQQTSKHSPEHWRKLREGVVS